MNTYSHKSLAGFVALTTTIIIALFLFSVGMLMVIQSGTSIFSGQFSTQGDRAQFLAEAGIQDALVNIARNANTSSSYTITETDGTVNVSITTSSATTTLIVATSSVTQGSEIVIRSMRATVVYTATSGQILSVTKVNQ